MTGDEINTIRLIQAIPPVDRSSAKYLQAMRKKTAEHLKIDRFRNGSDVCWRCAHGLDVTYSGCLECMSANHRTPKPMD